ncbi:ATP-binding cassette domain-containing protein [uncultured Anaerococcus sp.]|uniref:ABC transporter ATP-binding protein n=1 Tax=uncultured Anaerococcus sp. TaxID=293428 RepID=UPI0028048275|nr:ATP-binding cassette domain-containing protein [uncultured Anaerococcus sp.]
MLSVENLSFSYDGKVEILKDLSLKLDRGEILGLMAPSGFGKSTLGKLMAGYLKAEKGKIAVDGLDINDLSGFLPVQMVHQAPEKNVNIRWKVEKILNEGWQVNEYVKEKFGIEESFLKKFPTELSGGELQRICIARVLSSETKYLIADEVTTMLDSITQAQICHLLKHFAKEHNLGILFISHNEALIDAIADRKINLKEINKI